MPQKTREDKAMATVPDPKELEGRKEGQTPAPQSRDFFWDSITLYVVSAILALTAIDVVTELVRGSELHCYLPNETDSSLLPNVQGYVNEFCTARLPLLQQYLPAFIAIHAIAILAPHYIWLNYHGADLDFFFQLVSKLHRTRNYKTGRYALINYVVWKQLEGAFSHSNGMYWSYIFLKVLVQLCICIVGFLSALLWMLEDEQGDPFECPMDDNDTKGDYWPLPDYEKVICVISSIHLFQRIWVVYLVLLSVTALCLLVNIFTIAWWHTDELGNKNRAIFSFQTGLSYHKYKPDMNIRKLCRTTEAEEHPQGDAAQGDAAQGDAAQGDAAQGDAAQGGAAQGGAAQGGAAQGDAAQGDAAQGDAAQGQGTRHLCQRIWHLCQRIWHLRQRIWHLCQRIWHLRQRIWHLCQRIWHLCQRIWHHCQCIWHHRQRIWHLCKFSLASYRIKSNYDFLVVKLFRTDGSLAYVLRDVHVVGLLQIENTTDLAKANLYISQRPLPEEYITGGLKYIYIYICM